ncbi:uncharacterized protein LOC111371923 [Olea europaea var. sylvestris]|uniref:uncharacterized protein LOC111371923 n=1 Tax=Olea europaea var. sylvestris TaxID=158386 RepID=UPI000C1CF920|nr:uncharacterized protein LOC111371923 [Olea europaea var. sylvestris]
MEVLTMKMDNLSKFVNMVHQSPPIYEGSGADHDSTHCPLTSTHANQFKEVNYAQNFQRQQNNPFSNTYNPDKATEENQVESSDSPQVKATTPIKAYVLSIPFPQRLQKHKLDNYAKFMKDILSNKRKLEDNETVMLTEECSAIFQHKLPPKLKDPGSFTIPCNIGLGKAKSTTVSLQLADRSIKHPRCICEDILAKEDRDVPLILGRPFFATRRALINVQNRQLILRLNEEELTINVFRAFRFQSELDSCMQIDVIKEVVSETFKLDRPQDPLEACLVHSQYLPSEKEEVEEFACYLTTIPPFFKQPRLERGGRPKTPLPSIQQALALELKQLPTHLHYAYLGKKNSLSVII